MDFRRLGRRDGGGGGSEIRQNGVEMGFRFEMGSGGRERRDVGQFRIWSRPAQLELCESKTIAAACGVGPVSMPVDFECRYGARKKNQIRVNGYVHILTACSRIKTLHDKFS